MLIRPEEKTPAERVRAGEVSELSDAEVVSLALGLKLETATAILSATPLDEIETHALAHDRMVSVRLLACLEVGRRVAHRRVPKERVIASSKTVIEAYRPRLGHLHEEQVWCVFLNARHRPMAERMFAHGLPASAPVYVGAMIAHALRIGAVAMLMVHNHPSGDPAPSQDDVRLTAQAVKACQLVELALLDHVIITADRSFSFLDSGLLPGKDQ